jgi:hypothetical protein
MGRCQKAGTGFSVLGRHQLGRNSTCLLGSRLLAQKLPLHLPLDITLATHDLRNTVQPGHGFEKISGANFGELSQLQPGAAMRRPPLFNSNRLVNLVLNPRLGNP